MIVSQLVVTPIETVMLRLDAQRPTDLAEQAGKEGLVRENEPTLSIRKEPYHGFWSCVQEIVREEGWLALNRGWIADASLNLLCLGFVRKVDVLDHALQHAIQRARLAGVDV